MSELQFKLNELKHQPMLGLSAKYQSISTVQAVQPLLERGYELTGVSLRRVSKKKMERAGHQFHVVRLRKINETQQIGDTFPEIIISNSYDGTSSLTVRFGLFRLVCANGLVVGTNIVAPVRIRHVGQDLERRVIDAVAEIEGQAAKLDSMIVKGQKVGIIDPMNFAAKLIKPQFEGLEKLTTLPIRREGDLDNSWNVFNLVQENLLSRGGVRGIFKVVKENGEVEYKERALKVKRGTMSALDSNVKLFDAYSDFLAAA